ncbi:unnamed protein product [Dracunculus medinensis]|uniref:DUF3456 domain-containing protein n=1 Tax=Dracunculus medinensis TaxID=318479 RepID=A0A0N4UF24_DRAME|nr:unnamed protein product [Dracunculus medinensis]
MEAEYTNSLISVIVAELLRGLCWHLLLYYLIPYARSEAHIHELLEYICDKSKEYSIVTHPITGKSVYVRKDSTSRVGSVDKTVLSKLNAACSDFLDDHEEELVNFMKIVQNEPVREFCHRRLNICTSVDVTPFPDLINESARHFDESHEL